MIRQAWYTCTRECGFNTGNPDKFLRHIEGCIHVARWIGGWAKRMKERNDWRERVGLGKDLGLR